MEDFSTTAAIVVAAAMFLGAVVKGASGFGLPLVVLPMTALVLPPQTAMALLAVPIVGSNVIQAAQSDWRGAIARFWPMILASIAGLLVGVQFLTRADPVHLQLLVGVAVTAVGAVQLAGVAVPTPGPEREPRANVLVGLLSGVLGGMTSLFGPLVIPYLVALRLDRELFVAALAVFYGASMIPFYATLASLGILGPSELAASAASMVPIAAGMLAGTALRRRIPPGPFRRMVLVLLVILGLAMIARAVGGP